MLWIGSFKNSQGKRGTWLIRAENKALAEIVALDLAEKSQSDFLNVIPVKSAISEMWLNILNAGTLKWLAFTLLQLVILEIGYFMRLNDWILGFLCVTSVSTAGIFSRKLTKYTERKNQ